MFSSAGAVRAPALTRVGIFLGLGILITIFSMIIGIPLARLIERLKIAVIGGVLGISFWFSYSRRKKT